VRYVGYHESICGDGSVMTAFEKGYKAGRAAGLRTASNKLKAKRSS
jgi:uncharacterized protein YunC (DUF1805 family)